ncbi:hypothetical protein B0H17DRAFT_1336084 [Mycena rosella]|uniref:Uncharacterized protein n=1 Tax=Mycena rosella TaxID=1033263 RepID=A0AAD7G931_MYCRO|nr:hypothetical protein B0H17DRAFT_1336084 [Mycena rosella]
MSTVLSQHPPVTASASQPALRPSQPAVRAQSCAHHPAANLEFIGSSFSDPPIPVDTPVHALEMAHLPHTDADPLDHIVVAYGRFTRYRAVARLRCTATAAACASMLLPPRRLNPAAQTGCGAGYSRPVAAVSCRRPAPPARSTVYELEATIPRRAQSRSPPRWQLDQPWRSRPGGPMHAGPVVGTSGPSPVSALDPRPGPILLPAQTRYLSAFPSNEAPETRCAGESNVGHYRRNPRAPYPPQLEVHHPRRDSTYTFLLSGHRDWPLHGPFPAAAVPPKCYNSLGASSALAPQSPLRPRELLRHPTHAQGGVPRTYATLTRAETHTSAPPLSPNATESHPSSSPLPRPRGPAEGPLRIAVQVRLHYVTVEVPIDAPHRPASSPQRIRVRPRGAQARCERGDSAWCAGGHGGKGADARCAVEGADAASCATATPGSSPALKITKARLANAVSGSAATAPAYQGPGASPSRPYLDSRGRRRRRDPFEDSSDAGPNVLSRENKTIGHPLRWPDVEEYAEEHGHPAVLDLRLGAVYAGAQEQLSTRSLINSDYNLKLAPTSRPAENDADLAPAAVPISPPITDALIYAPARCFAILFLSGTIFKFGADGVSSGLEERATADPWLLIRGGQEDCSSSAALTSVYSYHRCFNQRRQHDGVVFQAGLQGALPSARPAAL